MSQHERDNADIVRDPQRLAALRRTALLDTPVEESFDRLTRLAAKLIAAPVTFLSLVDENRDFYKSCFGFPEPLASQRQLDGTTFCHYTLRSSEPLIIDDTRAHPVYRNVPTVESLGVAAYLGIPLVTSDGQALGSFCAIDFLPRQWRPLDIEIMTELATSTMREIELRNAHKAAADERRVLETAMRQMPAGVMIATPDGRIVLSNARAREITGRDVTDLDAEGAKADAWPLARALRNGEIIENEPDTFDRADGSTGHVLVSAAPVVDGEVIAAVVTLHDVTAAHHAQQERERLLQHLDEERSRLRTVIEQVPAGVLFAEAPSGRIVMANRQIHEILGHAPLESQNVGEYREWIGFHADGRRVQGEEWPLARALRGEIIRGEDVLYQRGDGRLSWIRIHGAPVIDAGGTIVGSIVAFYDVDEAHRAEQAKDEFFAAVTHELRTPMTSIIGWSRILKMEELSNPSVIEAAGMIESSARVQARLVDDLLDVSRIAAGKIALNRESLDVNEVIEEALRAEEPSASAKHIALRSSLGTVPPVHADRARLRQILGNLMANAVKFTPEGGSVEITSANGGGDVVITVRDSGRGIAPAFLPHIFERGRQARNAEQGGLGLGLTIVRHLVEEHGGTIRADSDGIGHGATFTVTLPVS